MGPSYGCHGLCTREGWRFDGFLRCVNVVGDYMMMTIMTNRFPTGPAPPSF